MTERLVINSKGEEKEVKPGYFASQKFPDRKLIAPDIHQQTLHNLIETQRVRRERDPSQNEATTEIKTDKRWVANHITGDWHLGSERTDYELWNRNMGLVKQTEGMFMSIVGDERDNFVIPKYPTGRDEHLITPQQQAEMVEHVLGDLDGEGKILARTGGNHDCLDDQTEIYTERGWLNYQELKYTDLVLTNLNGFLSWHKPKKILIYKHKGQMIKIKTRTIDLMVTDNHRIYRRNRKGNTWNFVYADKFSNKKWGTQDLIPVAGSFDNKEYPIRDDLLRLIGWLVTDGGISKQSKNSYRISFWQRKEKAGLIQAILDRLGYEYVYSERKRNIKTILGKFLRKIDVQCEFRLKPTYTKKLLRYIKSTKEIPDWIENISNRQFNIFLDSVIDGDGSRKRDTDGCAMVYQSNKQFIDKLQALCATHNIRSTITEYRKGEFRLNIAYKDFVEIGNPNEVSKVVEYEGDIWCITVKNENFLIRRNGKCCFTGNSWTWTQSGIKLEDFWYRKMKSPLFSNGGFLHVKLENIKSSLKASYDFYLHHGLTIFNSNFNPNHAVKRAYEFQGKFDVGAMGHSHVAEIAHGYRNNDSQQHDYVQMRTGTCKIDDQYARSRQLGRGHPAGTTVILNTETRRMMPFLKLEDAVEVLEALNK